MTLHLEQIIHDVERMTTRLNAGERREWLQRARRLLREHDHRRLEDKLEQHRIEQGVGLAPTPLGRLDKRIPAPAVPSDYCVAAADGSNIPPDRENPARYFLLNMGLVFLCYGERPSATIDAHAQLFYEREDLYWDREQEIPIDSRRLSLLMRIEEIASLPDLVEHQERPAMVLVDGQLIMWGLQNEVEDRWGLMERLLDALDRLRDLRIPIAGYISDTESFELVNALRIYLCPTSRNECNQCHTKGKAELELCYYLNDFRDPALLFDFLEAGERTCCFGSNAEILSQYTAAHRIVYFYMSTGDEIARVEVPRWVAEDSELLDAVHAILHDQCRRSGQQPPYPPVLHEAHEAAVITTGDRESVRLLVEEQLHHSGVLRLRPAKSFHKRLRGV